ncbi:MAG: hypothetical protein RJA76_1147 [Bacteroidota bacterium]|jgi:hypothetical protein
MKYLRRLFYLLFLTSLHLACSSGNESDKPQEGEEISVEIKRQIEAWDQLSPIAQKIIGTHEGIVRGKVWGQDMESINEPLEKSENQPSNGVSFTQYLDNTDLNFVDISYLGENGKLSDIIFDIFLEDSNEVGKLKQELRGFLKVKFGEPRISNNKETWKYEKSRIILEDVSTSKDPGLQMVFRNNP